jgi:UDP-N-acetyl-D-galactosamine dehydrogenase
MKLKIRVINQRYVGRPLSIDFGNLYPTIGFDISEKIIRELIKGIDLILEILEEELISSKQLQ